MIDGWLGLKYASGNHLLWVLCIVVTLTKIKDFQINNKLKSNARLAMLEIEYFSMLHYIYLFHLKFVYQIMLYNFFKSYHFHFSFLRIQKAENI